MKLEVQDKEQCTRRRFAWQKHLESLGLNPHILALARFDLNDSIRFYSYFLSPESYGTRVRLLFLILKTLLS